MPADQGDTGADGEFEGVEHESAPWHFKLLLVAFVLYLLYRLVQLVIWGVERIL